MRPFIKRTIQGRVKDLTDDYIGEQGSGLEPEGSSTRNSDSTYSYSLSEDQGGEMRVSSDARTNWNLQIEQGASEVVDYAKKPPEMKHPDIEYIEWDQHWNLVQ